MAFHYRLQKILDFRIRKKEEQLQEVLKAQQEVSRVEQLIKSNEQEILNTRENMKKDSPLMYERYDLFLKHLYEEGERLEVMLKEAQEKLEEEKLKLIEREKDVKIIEKHKEKMKDAYKEEEKKAELKTFSDVGVQRHFQKTRDNQEEEEALQELIKKFENNELT